MKLCIVGHTTWTLPSRGTGGAERQIAFLAETLAGRGHQITCLAPGWPGPERVQDGVRALPAWDESRGVKGLRWITYRLPQLRRLLMEAGADACYCRGFSIFAPTMVSAARTRKARSWIGLAHDTDLSHYAGAGAAAGNTMAKWSNGRLASAYFMHRGLRLADLVVAQNRAQLERCRSLRLKAVTIRNIVKPAGMPSRPATEPADVAWVGSLSRWKGIEKLDEVISALPDISFKIIGPTVDPTLDTFTGALFRRKNVMWTGELSHDQVLDHVAGSKILINTSPQEGFANTMLEAWGLGRPVLSLSADPDGLFSGEEALGECAHGDVKVLCALIQQWLADEARRRQTGLRAIQYVRDNHSPEAVGEAYERLFKGESDRVAGTAS